MEEPCWATEIIKEVCLAYNRRVPEIVWRQRKGVHTTGSTQRKKERIAITLGTDTIDHKRVLLHELAHYLNESENRGHSKEFWLILRALFIKYDCLTDEYRQRESRYRGSSLLHL